MRMIMATVSLCSLGIMTSTLLGQEKADAVTSDSIQKKLNGEWTVTRGVNQGRPMSDQQAMETRVIVRDNTLVVLDAGEKELYKASFRLVTTTKPHQINMVTRMPNQPETAALGIIELIKAGWKLCYGLPGNSRPNSFKSTADNSSMLFEMQPWVESEPVKLESANIETR